MVLVIVKFRTLFDAVNVNVVPVPPNLKFGILDPVLIVLVTASLPVISTVILEAIDAPELNIRNTVAAVV